jgi:sRNA-binding carbon storage regulator CsrA
MSRFVRYTCNKKNEPTLREDCESCPEFNPCAKDGQWCFVGALVAKSFAEGGLIARGSININENLAMPVMRDTSTVKIPVGNGQSIDILKEDIKKAIESEIYKSVREEYLKR